MTRATSVHHSTTSCTMLPGCWARLRVGLPSPYRSGLLDGKCVWRLLRHISLSPLCIACLDPTSTTSGWTMWLQRVVKALQHLPTPDNCLFFFDWFLFLFFVQIIRNGQTAVGKQAPTAHEWMKLTVKVLKRQFSIHVPTFKLNYVDKSRRSSHKTQYQITIDRNIQLPCI